MPNRTIRVILHGATGRIGVGQHLTRALCAIRHEGGVLLSDGSRVMPEPVLVGRNPEKLAQVALDAGIDHWTTDLPAALANPEEAIFFDSGSPLERARVVRLALAAGKHVYVEKPLATTVVDALDLCRRAEHAGVRHGVVHSNLWLPGIIKLRTLVDAGFFGRILAIRGEFGYWIFEGDWMSAQRPSWNYRREDGGGLVRDIMSHWSYELEHLVGDIAAVSCLATTQIPERWDESGARYTATADDTAFVTLRFANGAIGQLNNSWCTRVRRDDLMTIQIDGTHGSAVAGIVRCVAQGRSGTPKPVWNPEAAPRSYFDDWHDVPDTRIYDNPFKAQWSQFIRHVVEGAPFPWGFPSAAKGVQLAELCEESVQALRWIDVP